MKKCCICICLFICLLFLKKEETSMFVFEEMDKSEFVVVKIDVSNTSITTKTITSLLDSLILCNVEYEIPKLYQLKFPNQDLEYHFAGISNQRGLLEIEKTVSRFMKEMGNQKEVERISFYGVKLRSIEIYGNIEKIEELKQKLKDH